MVKISLVIPDKELAEIDAQAGGDRTAFIVTSSLEKARFLRRAQVDAEIQASLAESWQRDLAVYRDWEPTMADGL